MFRNNLYKLNVLLVNIVLIGVLGCSTSSEVSDVGTSVQTEGKKNRN